MRWAVTLLCLVACGARSDLDGADGGTGGAITRSVSSSVRATSQSANSVGASSTSGVLAECTSLVLDGLPYQLGDARAPDLGFTPDLRLAWHSGRFIFSQVLQPETIWPATFGNPDQDLHIGDFASFVMAPDSSPQTFLWSADQNRAVLHTGLSPMDPLPANVGPTLSFVATANNRYLFAGSSPGVFEVGSYELGGLPQNQEPVLCLSSKPLGAAIAKGEGFVAAYTDTDPVGISCSSQVPQPARAIHVMRYFPGGGPALSSDSVMVMPLSEPLSHLGLVETGFGAWLVFQTDGSTSFQSPPIMAVRLNHNGGVNLNETFRAVSPEGVVTPVLAVAAVGDALAVVWVKDNDLAKQPTLEVQLVQSDGTLGPHATVPTVVPPQWGRLRAIATKDGRSLILAWDSTNTAVSLAKLDCLR